MAEEEYWSAKYEPFSLRAEFRSVDRAAYMASHSTTHSPFEVFVLGEMSHSTIRTRVVESLVEGSSVALALWIERGGVVVVEVDGMISFGGDVEV